MDIRRRAFLTASVTAASTLMLPPRQQARAEGALASVGIPLIGVNTGAPAQTTGTPESQATYDNMLGLGAKIFRIYVYWQTLQPIDGGGLDSAALQALEQQVDYATKGGATAVIDIHNYNNRETTFVLAEDAPTGATSLTLTTAPTAFSNETTVVGAGVKGTPSTLATLAAGSPTIQLSQPLTAALNAGAQVALLAQIGTGYPVANFVDFWAQLAQVAAFKSRSNVWFGLMNEPGGTSASWTAICNQTIAAIRAAGADNVISASNAPGGGHFIQGLDYVDPLRRLVYEIHFYGDAGSSGSGPVATPTIYAETLSYSVNVARAQNQKLFLGECGFDTSQTSLSALAGMLYYLQRNTDVVDALALWYDGVGQPANYLYQLAATNGEQAPQVEILRAFMPGATDSGACVAAPVFPLVCYGGSTAAQYDSMPSFGGKGQALTSTATQIYSKNPTVYNQSMTAEGLISLAGPPATSCGVWGNARYHTLQVTTAGTVLVTCGDGAAKVTLQGSRDVCDGQEHRVEVNLGPKGIWVFIDGTLEVLNKTPFSQTSPQALRWGVGVLGQQSTNYGMWPGTLREHTLWAVVRHLRDYTLPTAPYQGTERGLIVYWDLNGSLQGYC